MNEAGMLDDSEIDVVAILQAIGKALTDQLGYTPDAVIILRAPDGQCRTMMAANPAITPAESARKELSSMLEQAVKQNRLVSDKAPLRL